MHRLCATLALCRPFITCREAASGPGLTSLTHAMTVSRIRRETADRIWLEPK